MKEPFAITLVCAFTLVATGGALAQDSTQAFDALKNRLRSGDTILVTDQKGKTTKGKLGDLSVSTLELLSLNEGTDRGRGAKRFPQPDIAEIRLERPDSPGNGALIGFTPGIVIAFLAVLACKCAELALPPLVVVGGTGAAIGALVDASIHERETIYVNRGPRTSPSPAKVTFSPTVTKHGGAVVVSVRF